MTGLGLEVEVGVAPVEVGGATVEVGKTPVGGAPVEVGVGTVEVGVEVGVGVTVEFLGICGNSTNKTRVTYRRCNE